jgi:hypothetical protein
MSNLEVLLPQDDPQRAAERRRAVAIAAAALEGGILPLFGLARLSDGTARDDPKLAQTQLNGAHAAILSLTQSYAARLRLLLADRAHWEALRPRAPIIDWPLLTLHVALHRRKLITGADQISEIGGGDSLVRELHVFLTTLADEISSGEAITMSGAY